MIEDLAVEPRRIGKTTVHINRTIDAALSCKDGENILFVSPTLLASERAMGVMIEWLEKRRINNDRSLVKRDVNVWRADGTKSKIRFVFSTETNNTRGLK